MKEPTRKQLLAEDTEMQVRKVLRIDRRPVPGDEVRGGGSA